MHRKIYFILLSLLTLCAVSCSGEDDSPAVSIVPNTSEPLSFKYNGTLKSFDNFEIGGVALVEGEYLRNFSATEKDHPENKVTFTIVQRASDNLIKMRSFQYLESNEIKFYNYQPTSNIVAYHSHVLRGTFRGVVSEVGTDNEITEGNLNMSY